LTHPIYVKHDQVKRINVKMRDMRTRFGTTGTKKISNIDFSF